MQFKGVSAQTGQRGFTLLEILIVVAVLGILAAFTLVGFMNMRKAYQLDFATKEVRQMFELARSHTLASREDTSYGVAVLEDRVVLFAGTVYDPANPDNQEYTLPGSTETANADFGGATEMYFTLGMGEANAAGALDVRLVDEPSRSNTVTVLKTGIISAE